MKKSQEKVREKGKRKIECKENYVPIGKMVLEASKKELETVELRELQQEFNKDYMDELRKAAVDGKKRHPDFNSYFVVVLMKRERLMKKVLRNYFTTRVTCPTPAYDQTVYSFDKQTEDLKFLWVIPAKESCRRIYSQRYIVGQPYGDLMPYVVDFYEGKLNSLEQHLNANIERNK